MGGIGSPKGEPDRNAGPGDDRSNRLRSGDRNSEGRLTDLAWPDGLLRGRSSSVAVLRRTEVLSLATVPRISLLLQQCMISGASSRDPEKEASDLRRGPFARSGSCNGPSPALRIHHRPGGQAMPASVTPFLMFEGQADEAMNFYVKTIPDSEILNVQPRPGRPRPGRLHLRRHLLPPRPAGDGERQLHQTRLHVHAVHLAFRHLPERRGGRGTQHCLAEGGQYLMPLDNYGFSRRFAWVVDRFGVSWQVNLPYLARAGRSRIATAEVSPAGSGSGSRTYRRTPR